MRYNIAMKILAFFITCTLALYGAHIDDFASEAGYERDYNTSLSKALKQDRLIMLVVVADYCPWCRKMERKTLKAQSVAKKVISDFVPMIVDRNRDKAHYPKMYDTPRIPTIFFIDPHTQEHLYESIAYVKEDEFLQTLDDVLKMYKKNK
jgi:thiol:disulfide interchange protein